MELPHVVPDGLAFCADGSFLISCYRPDTVLRVLPSGDLTILMDDYEGTILGAPTNVCFGGSIWRAVLGQFGAVASGDECPHRAEGCTLILP